MRKAILVGINRYNDPHALKCPVKDAEEVGKLLKTNEDDLHNFDVSVYKDVPTKSELRRLIYEAFNDDEEIALFYFSGHGIRDAHHTYLVTPDTKPYDPGVSVNDLIIIANESKARNRIIILDCCYSGAAGIAATFGGSAAYIGTGVTILAASKPAQRAWEINGHSIFTSLLIEALKGGAADISGNITLASIYAYMDKALGAFQQRPVFKTNITGFLSIRQVKSKVPPDLIRMLTKYFPESDFNYPLDPSFEDTNAPDKVPKLIEPNANPEHTVIFKHLQKFQSVGLVEPVDAPYMYFAAMNSKFCRLTPLGQHYWYLAKHRL